MERVEGLGFGEDAKAKRGETRLWGQNLSNGGSKAALEGHV